MAQAKCPCGENGICSCPVHRGYFCRKCWDEHVVLNPNCQKRVDAWKELLADSAARDLGEMECQVGTYRSQIGTYSS